MTLLPSFFSCYHFVFVFFLLEVFSSFVFCILYFVFCILYFVFCILFFCFFCFFVFSVFLFFVFCFFVFCFLLFAFCFLFFVFCFLFFVLFFRWEPTRSAIHSKNKTVRKIHIFFVLFTFLIWKKKRGWHGLCKTQKNHDLEKKRLRQIESNPQNIPFVLLKKQ